MKMYLHSKNCSKGKAGSQEDLLSGEKIVPLVKVLGIKCLR